MAGPKENSDHQAINHLQILRFLNGRTGLGFVVVVVLFLHLSHWKDNPACVTFLVSMEICEHEDLHAVLPTLSCLRQLRTSVREFESIRKRLKTQSKL